MIRYRPCRGSLSASLKDEQTFNTLGEMFQYVLGRCAAFAAYVGSEPPALSDLSLVSLSGDNQLTGYHDECMIILRHDHCVGYCGQ